MSEPQQHIIDFAVEVSQWSPCRSKRGVVIFAGNDIKAHGYNYKPRGFDCDGSAACKATCRDEAIHAEQQALLSISRAAGGCDMLHVKTVNGSLVASGGPSCVQCSKFALICGITGVWLYHDEGWKRYEMVEFHRLSIAAFHGSEAGPQENRRISGSEARRLGAGAGMPREELSTVREQSTKGEQQ